jgi:hypothetical protein
MFACKSESIASAVRLENHFTFSIQNYFFVNVKAFGVNTGGDFDGLEIDGGSEFGGDCAGSVGFDGGLGLTVKWRRSGDGHGMVTV